MVLFQDCSLLTGCTGKLMQRHTKLPLSCGVSARPPMTSAMSSFAGFLAGFSFGGCEVYSLKHAVGMWCDVGHF